MEVASLINISIISEALCQGGKETGNVHSGANGNRWGVWEIVAHTSVPTPQAIRAFRVSASAGNADAASFEPVSTDVGGAALASAEVTRVASLVVSLVALARVWRRPRWWPLVCSR